MAAKKGDVFLGTIKKCIKFKEYSEYGDSRYIPEFEMRTISIGTTEVYAAEIVKNALLVRTKKGYLYIDLLENFLERFLADMGIAVKTLQTKPRYDGDYFVDVNSLKPYFELDTNLNDEKTQISVQKLVKTNKQA